MSKPNEKPTPDSNIDDGVASKKKVVITKQQIEGLKKVALLKGINHPTSAGVFIRKGTDDFKQLARGGMGGNPTKALADNLKVEIK